MLPRHSADDALAKASNVHSLLFENNRLRVLQVEVPPGVVAPMHWHPENVLYLLTTGKVRVSKPDSEPTILELQANSVKAMGEGFHEVENIGGTPMKAVLVELKT